MSLPDINLLRSFVAPAEQDYHRLTIPQVIYPVTRPEIYLKLQNSLANRARITPMARPQPILVSRHSSSRHGIQRAQPIGEGDAAVCGTVTPNIDVVMHSITYKLHTVKGMNCIIHYFHWTHTFQRREKFRC